MEFKIVKKLVMLARNDGTTREHMVNELLGKCKDAEQLNKAVDEVFSMSDLDWTEMKKTFVHTLDMPSE